jgi:hypothetical protein
LPFCAVRTVYPLSSGTYFNEIPDVVFIICDHNVHAIHKPPACRYLLNQRVIKLPVSCVLLPLCGMT